MVIIKYWSTGAQHQWHTVQFSLLTTVNTNVSIFRNKPPSVINSILNSSVFKQNALSWKYLSICNVRFTYREELPMDQVMALKKYQVRTKLRKFRAL